MSTQPNQPAEEVKRLQRCIDDLVGLTALPAIWSGGDPSMIARTLLESLMSMLQLEFMYVRLCDPDGGPPREMIRLAPPLEQTTEPREIGPALERSLGEALPQWPTRARLRIGDTDLSVASARLGPQGNFGVVVAGSRRSGFPGQTESLLLSVAANQAAVALQEASRLAKEKREALLAGEADARLIVGNIPGIVLFFMTPDGQHEVASPQLTKYFGRTLPELKHWMTDDTVHPEDRPHAVEVFKRAITSGESYKFEARFRRVDGVYQWFQCRGMPRRDATGRITRWSCVGIDIDERKRAEEAARESERNWRLAVDSIPGLVAVFTAAGEVEFVNEQNRKYFGRTLEELKRWGVSDACHPEDLPRAIDVFTRSIATGEPFDLEVRARRFDGAYRWFQSRGSPLRDADGRIVRWYNLLIDIDERKRVEEALRQSEARLAATERNLQLTIGSIPAMAWAARVDGSAEFINQHYLDYVGRSHEEMQDWGWTDRVHPDDLNGLARTWRSILASSQPGEAEARIRRFDDEYRWFLLRANPLRDENGAIVKWYGVNTDIDDRKRTETLLAGEKQLLEMIASGRLLRDVLSALCSLVEEAAPDCYCGIHPIDWSGPTFEYGVAPSLPSSYTTPISGLPVSAELLPCGIAANQKIQVIAEDIESDARWRTSSVRAHALEYGLRAVWSTPVFSKEGHVLGTLCVFQRKPARPSPHHQSVISYATHIASIAIERSRTEAALRRSETLLAEGQKISATGTYAWSGDPTERMFLSEEFYRIFEYDQGKGLTFAQLTERFHPEDRALLAEKIERINVGLENPEFQIRLRMPDSRIKYLRVLGRVIHHQDGRLERVGAVQDITQRRMAEEALDKVRSELMHVTRVMSLGALTASIAHEVNQPLAGIITNASTCLRMLAADPPNVDGARETARRTIRDGNRAADVIARLRALFSKKDAVIETVDLSEAAREVLALVSGDLLRNRVILRAELGGAPLLVTGDRVQLQQVILNLVRNAVEAMGDVNDRPRQLLISSALGEEGNALLTVKDSGPGFEATDAEKLFDAFYTTKDGGTGIGLSISRSIIENHGGKLWTYPNDGPGATFSFSIPRQDESAGDEGTSGAVSTCPTRGGHDQARNTEW
jgi:PAS domain S-box-containing protein